MFNKKDIFDEMKKEIGDIIQLLNSTTACVTGHRSQKLPWKFNENDERCIRMKQKLKEEFIKAIERGYTTFITGMALGFDMICAEILLELKKKYKFIKIIGALPCRNQDKLWPAKEKERYRKLLDKLDAIRCIYNEYNGAECMHERNHYMVSNSSLIIALYNGLPGGTQKTIEFAKQQGLDVVIIEP